MSAARRGRCLLIEEACVVTGRNLNLAAGEGLELGAEGLVVLDNDLQAVLLEHAVWTATRTGAVSMPGYDGHGDLPTARCGTRRADAQNITAGGQHHRREDYRAILRPKSGYWPGQPHGGPL